MYDFLISGIIFLGAVLIHIISHRILAIFKIKTFKTTIVFVFALLFNAWLLLLTPSLFSQNFLFQTPRLPFTALLLNTLVVFIYILFFTSPFWGEKNPSFDIYFLIKKHTRLTRIKIFQHFSNEELIASRFHYLYLNGYIDKKENTYYSLLKGERLIALINIYRRLLNWNEGG